MVSFPTQTHKFNGVPWCSHQSCIGLQEKNRAATLGQGSMTLKNTEARSCMNGCLLGEPPPRKKASLHHPKRGTNLETNTNTHTHQHTSTPALPNCLLETLDMFLFLTLDVLAPQSPDDPSRTERSLREGVVRQDPLQAQGPLGDRHLADQHRLAVVCRLPAGSGFHREQPHREYVSRLSSREVRIRVLSFLDV